MKPVKVVVYCQENKPDVDSYFKINGCLNLNLQEKSGAEIIYKDFGGHLTGDNREKFLAECVDADVVILDAWTHPEDSYAVTEAQDEMLKIARAICSKNKTDVLAELMEGLHEVAVHTVAKPIRDYNDIRIIRAIKKADILKNRTYKTNIIYVVDDNEDNLLAAEAQLSPLGVILAEESYLRAIADIPVINPHVVLTDLMFPAEGANQGNESRHNFVGKEMDMGTYVAFKAVEQGVPIIAIVSDTNHHAHPVGHIAEQFNTVGKINFFCGNRCPMIFEPKRVKNWSKVIQSYY